MIVAAAAVATLAFWAYTQTLLPGVDLGDTGGFQAAVLWPQVSARQAYPLYYDLAAPFVHGVSAANPARGLNLFSAIFGAAAVGLLTLLASLVCASPVAGVAAGLLLAFSYTFWSQAIIAEVYTLHLALVVACCCALYTYAAQPSRARLAIFFAIYALAFGNHLAMILLFVPFTLFLVQVTPERRALLAPATIAAAVAIALAGALQYWPNFSSVWRYAGAPVAWSDRFATFWFDTTKSDWRDTMVLGVTGNQFAARLGMWWFDARQQFGVAGLVLALLGIVRLWMISRAWAMLVAAGYIINTLFAFTYNVGDTHVFYLPSHLFTAFAAGAVLSESAGSKRTRPARQILGAVVLLYAGWRAYDTWPAIDRHDDRRAETLVRRMAFRVNPQTGILVTNVNWQLENALLYYNRWERRDLPWVRLPDVELHFPFLVRDNEAISRDVVLDSYSAHEIVAAFGPAFPIAPDPFRASADLLERIATLPPGTPYVLCVLTPPREERLDAGMLKTATDMLIGGAGAASLPVPGRGAGPASLPVPGRAAGATSLPVPERGAGAASLPVPQAGGPAYQLMAGLTGAAPTVARAADYPFRVQFRLLDDPFTVRMESWLTFDTFRRAGFGHVLRGREHVMIVERGVNLVWFDRNARVAEPLYAAGLYAPGPRYRISSVSPSLARVLQ